MINNQLKSIKTTAVGNLKYKRVTRYKDDFGKELEDVDTYKISINPPLRVTVMSDGKYYLTSEPDFNYFVWMEAEEGLSGKEIIAKIRHLLAEYIFSLAELYRKNDSKNGKAYYQKMKDRIRIEVT